MPGDFNLIAYDEWRCFSPDKRAALAQRVVVHFFTDDYRFESVWNNPERTWGALSGVAAILTPDFSLYRDHPYAIQLWNTYRNRWLGAFWQDKRANVIPTVGWSDQASHSFSFAGLPSGSTLAISLVGCSRDPESLRLFNLGCEEMLRVAKPSVVLLYGDRARQHEALDTKTRVVRCEPWHSKLRSVGKYPAAPSSWEG